jgi:ATP-binding cassette, subfamily B, multidrug efflux pump
MNPSTSPASEPELFDLEVLRDLGAFLKPHRRLFLLSLASYPVVAGLTLLTPFLLKVGIDDHLVPRRLDGLSFLVVGFLALVAVEFLAKFGQTYITQLLGQYVTQDLRNAIFAKLQSVDLAYIESNPSGKLMTRAVNDVEALQETFSTGAVSLLGDLVTLTGIVVMMLFLNVRLTIYAFVVLPVLIGFVIFMKHRSRDAFRQVRYHLAQLNAFLSESLGAMNVIQSSRLETHFRDDFQGVNRDYRNANFAAIRYDAWTYAVVEGVSTIAIGLMLILGVRWIGKDGIEVGVFVAFVEYLRRFFQPITELSSKYTVLQSALTSGERIVSLLRETSRVYALSQPQEIPPNWSTLSFEDVSFRYGPNQPLAVKHLNFSIQRGEKLALVGRTGSGKSTIAKLLERFYDPTEGFIAIDGIDIRNFDLKTLRARIGLVTQTPYLAEGTVRDNILFSSGDVSEAALQRAVEKTHLSESMSGREEGLDTQVGFEGAQLSAGQRQLVVFARVLAMDPELLILDEATSAVDAETEFRIDQGLERVLEGRTAVIIAHRLQTIRKADRIIVLHDGEVAESGTHENLLAQLGLYHKLCRQYAEHESPTYAPGGTATTDSWLRNPS